MEATLPGPDGNWPAQVEEATAQSDNNDYEVEALVGKFEEALVPSTGETRSLAFQDWETEAIRTCHDFVQRFTDR